MIDCAKKHCCLSTIITYTHTHSLPKQFAPGLLQWSSLQAHSQEVHHCSSHFIHQAAHVAFLLHCCFPINIFLRLCFFLGKLVQPFFNSLLSNVLAVNEETACFFGFLNEPSSWLGTGNPETGQANSYSVWKICFG